MYYTKLFTFAAMAFGLASAAPHKKHSWGTRVHPNKDAVIITKQNTMNASSKLPAPMTAGPAQALPFDLVNNLGADVNAYVSGLDENGAIFMLQNDGSLYHPDSPPDGSQPVPITAPIAISVPAGQTVTINLNTYVSGGRVWFAQGDLLFQVNPGPALVEPSATNPEDPSADVNWGFVELTWGAPQIYANISYVDFVGMVISMMLETSSGNTQTVKGLPTGAVGTICDGLKDQANSDGAPWDTLCMLSSDGSTVLRVLSPNYVPGGADTAFGDYWTDYVNSVYDKYTGSVLTVNNPNGDVSGQVDGSGTLQLGSAGSFPKPNAADIFGCSSNTFANAGDDDHLGAVARLCAAFNRATFLLDGGDTQPNGVDESLYYTTSPTNHYARIVHENELDGEGYAFSYDDVVPSGGKDPSGAVVDPAPTKLTLTIGGVSS